MVSQLENDIELNENAQKIDLPHEQPPTDHTRSVDVNNWHVRLDLE